MSKFDPLHDYSFQASQLLHRAEACAKTMDADWCDGPDSEEIIADVVRTHGHRGT